MRWTLSVVITCLLCIAGDKPPRDRQAAARALASRIDAYLAASHKANSIKPAPTSEDAEFLRRLYLDLTGRIPLAFEVRDFLDNDLPDKRAFLIDALLGSPAYVTHFSHTMRAQLLPQNDQVRPTGVPGFEAWLRQKLKANVAYDELVRELLTTPLKPERPPGRMENATNEPNPSAYFQMNERKPESLAASTSRLFLGVKLECAQCHDHPMASWKRKQFWEFAAFFTDLEGRSDRKQAEIRIPGIDKTVSARFLDGVEPSWKDPQLPQKRLADWITSPKNDYFARTAANRIWAHLMGIGIIEPVDEVNPENPPSHPELLDELTRELIQSKFDLKYLIQAIANSQAYQRTSRKTDPSQNDPRLYGRMAIKGLSPEQLFESFQQATGFRDAAPALNARPDLISPNSPRAEFFSKFTNQEKRNEYETSILQALTLMNGKLIADATSHERSETLSALLESPFGDTPQRIETLYLMSLSRKPKPAELDRAIRFVKDRASQSSEKTALADVLWALLNSGEFMLNH